MRILLALVLAAALSACSSQKESPEPTAPTQRDASRTPACAEVREGIGAFNRSEFANTVAHFRLALPLARTQARTAPSPAADDLVEAVRYYAGLAPDDYPQAALSSPAFAKYKAITLGQCQPVGSPSQEESAGPPQVTA